MAFLIFRIVFKGLTKELLGGSQVALSGVDHRQISARLDQLRFQVKRGFEPLLRGLQVAVANSRLA